MRKRKMILSFAIIMVFNIIMTNFSFANEDLLMRYTVLYSKNENRYISYNGVSQRFFDYYYINENNERLDAYCTTLGRDGAETTQNGYLVDAGSFEEDQNIINILNNGYPHRSPSELGLETRDQAKFATQFALWIYTNNLDISKIGWINDKSDLVTNAIKNIYNSKSTVRTLDDTFNMTEVSSEIVSINGTSYYKVGFNVEVGSDISKIEKNFTDENIKIVNENLEEITNIADVSTLSVLYPVEKLTENKKIDLKFNVSYKNLRVRHGYPDDYLMQEVALILPEYEIKTSHKYFSLEYKKLELEITKTDSDTKEAIEGVEFKIYNAETNEVLGQFTTDKEGKIKIDFRKDLNVNNDINIKIEEVQAKAGYEKLKEPVETKLQYGECVSINIENDKVVEVPKQKTESRKQLPKTGM